LQKTQKHAPACYAGELGVSEFFMYLNRIIFFLLFFLAGTVFSSENMGRQDYDGNWNSNYVAVKNEKQLLKISLNSESVFERHFESRNSQILSTTEYKIIDDLLILSFTSLDKAFGYKLVLSGWTSKSKKVLYGSMFMYRSGVQFNMLPVSYASDN
jgi:hypothetical protein